MKIEILIIGKIRNKWYKSLGDMYQDRIKHYSKISVKVVKEEKIAGLSDKEIIKLEGERIMQNIDNSDYLAALDKNGQTTSSEEFASLLKSLQNQGRKKMIMVIGGPLGLSESVIRRSDIKLSLSKMTFAHELAFVILLEQIYRGFNFLSGGKYHK